jgi:wyosine [tRNA(Phe)-imidazoG37] synthetase (radical SAM superfamily)
MTEMTWPAHAAEALRSHPRSFGSFRYVYPVLSRRAGGISIGVNLTPTGACNFDCIYCQVDRTQLTEVDFLDLDAMLCELAALLDSVAPGALDAVPPFDVVDPTPRVVRDVALAGDGEPTVLRNFETVVDRVLRCMDKQPSASVPLRLFTNATRLDRPNVARAVDRIVAAGGEIWAKLDAGSEAAYRRINRCAVPFETVLSNLAGTARRVPIVVQSMFLRWGGMAPDPGEIEAYVERLEKIVRGGGRIDRVQVYTVARPPADPGIGPLEAEALEAIAGRVRARLTVPVAVFPAP